MQRLIGMSRLRASYFFLDMASYPLYAPAAGKEICPFRSPFAPLLSSGDYDISISTTNSILLPADCRGHRRPTCFVI